MPKTDSKDMFAATLNTVTAEVERKLARIKRESPELPEVEQLRICLTFHIAVLRTLLLEMNEKVGRWPEPAPTPAPETKAEAANERQP